MLLCELKIAIEKSKSILQKIKEKHPSIRVHLVLSTPLSIAPIDTNISTLLDECEDFFVETDVLKTVWNQLDDKWDLNEKLIELRQYKKTVQIQELEKRHSVLQEKYSELLELIEIDDSVCVCLRWDDIDFDIYRQLRADSVLVDVSRTPQLGGIRICLGTLSTLFQKLP